MTPSPRALVSRTFVALALIIVGTTCRDAPTEPMLDGSQASAQGGLTITPSLDTILVTQQVTLTATNSNGSAINRQATWTSSDTNVATVVSTGFSTSQVTARAPGSVTITGRAGPKDGTATIVVLQIPVASVSVTPDSASLQFGDSIQYTAVPRDSAGGALTGRVITWSAGDTLIARVSATGMARAIARGTTPVQATVEGVVGSKPLIVRVPQLDVPSVTTVDSANAGDTLVVAYTARNAQDAPNADTVIVRVGLRNSTTGAIYVAARRALARIGAGATTVDTVRLQIPLSIGNGPLSVVAYVDCGDSTSATNEQRLASCLATTATAGVIPEGNEGDNSRTSTVIVRGPELVATALTAPDSIFTRTSVNVTLGVNNTGSATGSAFDVVAGLYDVTAGSVVVAVSVTTPVLGSRQSRDVQLALAIPALLDAAHSYEVRAYADCKSTGTAAERLVACFANPATAGEIGEGIETNNSQTRAAVVASNVARVDAQPDSSLITALNDTTVLAASAFDRANAAVEGVSFTWTSLDPAIASATGALIRAHAVGTARIVLEAEGRVDTARVYVVQQAASIVASHDSVTLGSINETRQLTAAVRDRNANEIPGAAVAWSSLGETIATVSETGLVTAVAVGVTNVVAAHGAYADTVKIIVTQLPARLVATTDSSHLTFIGDTAHLAAVVYDNNGTVVPGASVTWSTLDESIASVTSAGVATALSDGVARIVATAQGGYADTVRVHVVRLVGGVRVQPDSQYISYVNGRDTVFAVATDSVGITIYGVPVTFSVLDTAIVRIDSVKPWGEPVVFAAYVTALRSGTGRIVASHGAFADTSWIYSQPQVDRIVIAPTGVIIPSLGDTVVFTATAYDLNNVVIPDAPLTWTLQPVTPAPLSMPTPGVVVAIDTGVVLLGVQSGTAGASTNVIVRQQAASIFAPDTIRLDALGAISGFTPQAFDARGNIVTNPPVAVVSLDPAIATYESGVITATAVGEARIVSSIQSVYDTTLVIVRQVVASIELSPSSAVTTAGGSFTVNPTVLDVNGQPVSGRIITWTSLNSQIATVNGTTVGQVIGVAEGVTAVIGSVDGVADTIPVAVNPAGFTHRWIGATSNDWNDAANWAPGIPDSTSSTYIPAGTPFSAHVQAGSARVGTFTVAAGAVITGDPIYGLIHAFGSVDNLGVIGPSIAISGQGGTVRGTFSGLGIWSPVSLAGRTVATQSVGVGSDYGGVSAGQLDINGHTLVTGALNAYFGKLIQDASTDSVIVTGSVNWSQAVWTSERSIVTAGVMLVGGDFFVHNSDTTLVSAGTHKIVFTGAGNHNVFNRDTLAGFNDVEVNGTLALPGGPQGVKGRLLLNAGSRVTTNSNFHLIMHSSLPEGPGTVELPFVKLVGSATLQANSTMAAPLTVEPGASLTLNGRKVDVAYFQNIGTLTMNNASDSLIVRGGTGFYGTHNLSAGVLAIEGGVTSGSVGMAQFAWNVSGSHKTVFNGTTAQSAEIGDTSSVTFQNIEVTNTAGVSFTRDVVIGGLLKLSGGGKVSANNTYPRYRTQLPDVAAGVYDVMTSIVTGNVTATRDLTISGGLMVDNGGHLRLAGHKITVAGFGNYNGTITMDSPGDTVVTGFASMYGAAHLSAGVMVVNGGMDVSPSPSVPGSGWNVSGTHKTVFAGTTQQYLNFGDTTAANLLHVDVRNPQGLVLNGNMNVRGLLRLLDGGKLSSNGFGMIRYWTQLPEVEGGVYEVMTSIVAGNIVASRNTVMPMGLMVDGGGSLRLAGHTLDVGMFGTYNGTLTMDNPADTLIARQQAGFNGIAQLTAGTIIAHGGFDVSPSPSVPGAVWNATGSQKTVFAGTTQQFAGINDTTLAFNHVDVSNPQGVTINGTATFRGLLRLLAGGRVIAGNNGMFKYATALPDLSQGTYEVMQSMVTGNVTPSANVVFPNGLIIVTGANLTLAGRKVDVGYFATYGGTLTMNNPADTLVLRNFASMYTPANLTAGTLLVLGDMDIGNFGGPPSQFFASGSHTTVFGGTVDQTIQWMDVNSTFGNLKIDNPQTVRFRKYESSVITPDTIRVTGALIASGNGLLTSTTPLTFKVSGGLNVNGLRLSSVTLDVAGTLAQFDNVTFYGAPADGLMRISNAGTGSAFTMNNIVFDFPAGGNFFWIAATDTDAGTGAFTLDIVSPQAADGPTYTQVSNGAVVGWRSATP